MKLALPTVLLAVALPALGLTLTAGLVTGTASAAQCGPGGSAHDVVGTALDVEQLANAQTVTAVAAGRHLPAAAAVIAVATALQESSLRNLPTGDRDSVGLFQQRATWGPLTARLDPVSSTGLFLDALARVPGWEHLPVTVASDRVQHSAHPWAVAKWETAASILVHDAWPNSAADTRTPKPGIDARLRASRTTTASCAGGGSDGMSLTGISAISAGYTPPSTETQAAVTRFALAQLGKPYEWGATGPDAWDCSGLTMRAWAAAGVALPRTTFQQVLTGQPVTSESDLQPGDLIFIAGLDGTPASPGHVGMYLGDVNGVPSLIHAPRTGKPVAVQALSAWHGQIVALRRPQPQITTRTATR